MTVSTTVSDAVLTGDGTSTVFPFAFRALAASHLRVTLQDTTAGTSAVQTLGTDYSVNGVGADAGSVAFVVAPPAGRRVVIEREVPATQETRYPESGTFPAAAHERALDLLTMIAQQLDRSRGRALQVPAGEATQELPLTAQRAGRLLAFDTLGRPVPYDTAILPDRITVSAAPPTVGGVDGDIWFQTP